MNHSQKKRLPSHMAQSVSPPRPHPGGIKGRSSSIKGIFDRVFNRGRGRIDQEVEVPQVVQSNLSKAFHEPQEETPQEDQWWNSWLGRTLHYARQRNFNAEQRARDAAAAKFNYLLKNPKAVRERNAINARRHRRWAHEDHERLKHAHAASGSTLSLEEWVRQKQQKPLPNMTTPDDIAMEQREEAYRKSVAALFNGGGESKSRSKKHRSKSKSNKGKKSHRRRH